MVVFESLDNDEIKSVCSVKKEHAYNSGDIIIAEGQDINEFIYLKSGLVKIFRTINNEKQQILNIATPMEFVSLLSVFSENKYKFSISAIEDTTVCMIDLTVVKNLVLSNGRFALGLMEKMSKNTDKIILQNLSLNMRQLRGRIAYILLLFANEIYHSESFDLPVSRKEIAQLIDMTTENVIRILSEFRKDGIIRINGKNIEIINKKLLEQIGAHG
jgi:CRP/FNR family transcriptional regulator